MSHITLENNKPVRSALVAFFLLPFVAWTQQPPLTPAFDAASVKYMGQTPGPGGSQRDPGRVSYHNIRLLQLIMLAYRVNPDQIEGPAWLGIEHYDVVATIPENTASNQVPIMLQNLLVERFALKVHREPRVRPVYALLVAAGGPKLTKAAGPSSAAASGDPPRRTFQVSTSGRLDLRDTTIEGLIRTLSSRLDRPIIDQTGIEGTFDITLDLSPNGPPVSPRSSARDVAPEISGPEDASIFAALRGLGLRLERQKASTDVLIVDNARKIPTEN